MRQYTLNDFLFDVAFFIPFRVYVSFLLHQMRCEAYSLWLYRRKTIDDAVIRFAQTSTLTKTVNFNDEFIR